MQIFRPAPPSASALLFQRLLVLLIVLAGLGGLAAAVEVLLEGPALFDLAWIALTLPGIPALIWLLVQSPRRLSFELSPERLRIHTAWGRREVDLRGAELQAAPEVSVGIRLFGIGMPGHGVGLFRADGETVLAYLSDLDHVVRIRPREGRTVLVTPADVSGFLAAAEQR